jgi:hypothetical protein
MIVETLTPQYISMLWDDLASSLIASGARHEA